MTRVWSSVALWIFPKNNTFSIIMFRWSLSQCCHSSPFSFNEYNKQEWTSAICSCCHCLWTSCCFKEVYFRFKPFSNNVQHESKKKFVGAFLSALSISRCFWHDKSYSTIKKKPHFQECFGNRTPVKSQGSKSAQKIMFWGPKSLLSYMTNSQVRQW